MRGHRRDRIRRTCWALAWAGAWFAALQLGLVLLLELGGPGVCDWAFEVKVERLLARLKEGRERTLVVMIGSSRTRIGLRAGKLCRHGRDPQLLTFNFGLSARGPVLELVCLRRLLATGIRPDLLFVEVLPPALTYSAGYPFEEHWLRGDHLQTQELAWLRPYACKPGNLLWQWCKSRWFPCTHYRNELLHLLSLDACTLEPPKSKQPVPVDDFGWQPHFKKVTAAQRTRFTRVAYGQYDESLADWHVARQPVQALAVILDLCRSRGIAAALVLMPEASTFRARYSPKLTARLQQVVADLQRHGHVPVIDARTWVADADFWDGHHLLPHGAEVFTRRFDREAVRPLIQIARKKGPHGPRILEPRTRDCR